MMILWFQKESPLKKGYKRRIVRIGSGVQNTFVRNKEDRFARIGVIKQSDGPEGK
jgi:hypothetical protein